MSLPYSQSSKTSSSGLQKCVAYTHILICNNFKSFQRSQFLFDLLNNFGSYEFSTEIKICIHWMNFIQLWMNIFFLNQFKWYAIIISASKKLQITYFMRERERHLCISLCNFCCWKAILRIYSRQILFETFLKLWKSRVVDDGFMA